MKYRKYYNSSSFSEQPIQLPTLFPLSPSLWSIEFPARLQNSNELQKLYIIKEIIVMLNMHLFALICLICCRERDEPFEKVFPPQHTPYTPLFFLFFLTESSLQNVNCTWSRRKPPWVQFDLVGPHYLSAQLSLSLAAWLWNWRRAARNRTAVGQQHL